jgi:hypothetical protein
MGVLSSLKSMFGTPSRATSGMRIGVMAAPD